MAKIPKEIPIKSKLKTVLFSNKTFLNALYKRANKIINSILFYYAFFLLPKQIFTQIIINIKTNKNGIIQILSINIQSVSHLNRME